MKAIKEIERLVGIFCAVDKSSTSTSPQMDQRVLADALRAGKKPTTSKPAWAGTNMRRIIMKSPLTKLAIAAVVLLACVIGLSLWRTTGSGIALADVLARIEKVKAYRSQWSSKITGEDPNKRYNFEEERGTWLISQEYGCKNKIEVLDPNGGESTFSECYIFPEKKTFIAIKPKQKKYWRIELDDSFAESWQKNNPDLRTSLKQILACKYESMGRSTIDGIEVEGFQTTDPNFFLSNFGGRKNKQIDVKIWVDVKTLLPVRYEDTSVDHEKKSHYYEHHDFQWDVPVDAAEFEPVIPDDYASVVIKEPARCTEETAIQGLKLWVELLGKYPDPEIIPVTNIPDVAPTALRSSFEKSETPAALRLKEEIKGLTDDEISNKLVDFLMPIRGLHSFCGMLEENEKEPKYYGKTVTPKDADKVLMRWKVSDNEYRVIYGDLHTETVSPAKLADLEAALPK